MKYLAFVVLEIILITPYLYHKCNFMLINLAVFYYIKLNTSSKI